MRFKTPDASIQGVPPAATLARALDQSQRVKNLVEKCADDLSTVNVALTQELAASGTTERVALAVEKSAEAEDKVKEASRKLAGVNAALKQEVRERHALEDRLTELTEQSELDRHAAFHDPLTGLPNRALFNDRLEQAFSQASRHGWTLAVMFLDLNNFKSVNDVHGHEVGDIVLRIMADRLRRTTRRNDTICRHGGDEFLYLLSEISDEADAIVIAQKLVVAIQEPCVVKLEKTSVTVVLGASIGVAFSPRHGRDAESLIRLADGAMYEAKSSKAEYRVAPSSVLA